MHLKKIFILFCLLISPFSNAWAFSDGSIIVIAQSDTLRPAMVAMVIFDENNFYAAPNSLHAQAAVATHIITTNSTSAIAVHKPQKPISRTKPIVFTKQKDSKVSPAQKNAQKLTFSNNSPLSNNNIGIGSNKSLAVVPSNYQNQNQNLQAVFIYSPKTYEKIIIKSSRKIILSHIFFAVSANYGKTSKIRPPPSC